MEQIQLGKWRRAAGVTLTGYMTRLSFWLFYLLTSFLFSSVALPDYQAGGERKKLNESHCPFLNVHFFCFILSSGVAIAFRMFSIKTYEE